MKLTNDSHMSFNISINENIAFENQNIHFTTRFAKSWMCPDFYAQLEQMEVCTTIVIEEKNISIFKN